MIPKEPTVIIGAGLAGLAAAYRLKKGYRLIESTGSHGGLCRTVEERGYRFDLTGHLLHLKKGAIRRLVMNLLDQEPLSVERSARIFFDGSYIHYPFQANLGGLAPEIAAECLSGFFEARAKMTVNPGAAPRSFEQFIDMHFGRGIARHFMIPYNSKLWGVHPREITSEWCERFVPVPDEKQVVAGALGVAQEKLGYNASFIYPATGIGELSDALAMKSGRIEYATRAGAIDFRRNRIAIRGEWVRYGALINTMPLAKLVPLIEDAPGRLKKLASNLRCTSLRYLDIAISKPARKPYHWIYVPERRFPFYRVGHYSEFSSRMAPKGRANLYVEMASRRPIDLASVMPKVSKGLVEMGILRTGSEIEFARPRSIPHAYAIYDGRRAESVSELLSWLEQHGIFSAGRYARWEYSTMEDALAQGMEAADKARGLGR